MSDNKIYGWRGKVLWVDLAAQTSREVDISDMCQDYLGSRGFATKLAWDHLDPKTGAFDDGNLLMFFNGPCTGTMVPGVGRGYVFAIGPQTFPNEHFTRSSMGGRWANGLKECGYDGLILENKSKDKVILKITDKGVEFHDGSRYWGQDTQNTQYMLKEDFGSERSDSLVIGPAGENLVRFASIHTLFSNVAGQGGFGAVMGDKKVKGIIFNGSTPLPVLDLDKIMDIRKEVLHMIHYQEGPLEDHGYFGFMKGTVFSSDELKEKGETSELTMGVNPCSGCGLGGRSCVSAPVVWTYKDVPPVYGSEAFSGVMKCVDMMTWGWNAETEPDKKWVKEGTGRDYRWPMNFKVGAEIANMGNLYGLNTYEISSFRLWFSELETIGVDVSKLIGMNYDVDDDTLWQRIITKIVRREGFFGEMAEGIARLGAKLGSPYKEYSTHAMNGYTDHALGTHCYLHLQYPYWIVPALLTATDVRDPLSDSGHRYFELTGMNYADGSVSYEYDPIVKQLWGDELATGPKSVLRKVNGGTMEEDEFDDLAYSWKEQPTIQLQNRGVVTGSGVFCDGVYPRYASDGSQKKIEGDPIGDFDMEAKILTAVTGVDYTTQKIEGIGEAIINMQRCYNVLEFNRDKEYDMTICDNIQPRGDWSTQKRIDKERFSDLLGRYYALRGWDENGIPTEEKLLELGLDQCNQKMKAYR